MQPNLSHLFETTPLWLDAFFVLTTLLTLCLFVATIRQVSPTGSIRFLIASVVWLAGLALLAHNRIFLHLDARPPGFVLVLAPPILLITGLFLTTSGRTWVNQLPLPTLTLLHTVRIPVELILYTLYLHQQVPQLMTFEGRNYDILAGLTAPIITYFVFRQKQLSTRWLLVWNVLALGLVLNIVVNAVLSAPLPFQQFAFEQPNVAILKAPYVWLPGFIVPVVLFSHAVVIYRLVVSR
jgi:hypothetical protein